MRHLHNCIIASLVLVVQACVVSHPALETDAVDYNRSLEVAQNRVLLLNVLRAKERRPMYFSDLTRMSGSLTGAGQMGLTLPFGGAASDLYTGSLGTSYSGQRSFDIGVLGSEKFTRGIMQPIDMRTFHYYLQQGWPRPLLFYLFVRRIDVSTPGHKFPLENEPGNVAKFLLFRTYAERLLARGFDIVSETKSIRLLPGFPPSSLTPDLVAKASKDGFEYVEDEGLSYLVKPATTFVLRARPREQTVENTTVTQLMGDKRKAKALGIDDTAVASAIDQGLQYVRTVDLEFPNMQPEAVSGTVMLYLRSPEAILYYLGEIARAAQAHSVAVVGGEVVFKSTHRHEHSVEDCIPMLKRTSTPELRPLFLAAQADHIEGDTVLEVAYDGTTYAIPSDGNLASQSMHCLSLVSQLLGLQKSSDEIPQSVPVRLIGN